MTEKQIAEYASLLVEAGDINAAYERYDACLWVVNVKNDSLPGENWTSHPRYHKVMVSDFGRIKINDKIADLFEMTSAYFQSKPKELPINKETLKRNGIGYVGVYIGDCKKLVYELVAETFCGPRPDGAIIHHKSDDGYDNRPKNLVYILPAVHRKIHSATSHKKTEYEPLVI